MVNQEYFSDNRISQVNFHFFQKRLEICCATPLDKPNIEVIFRVLTLILPLYDGSGRKSLGLV